MSRNEHEDGRAAPIGAWWQGIAVAVVAWAVYAASLGAGFVQDDIGLVEESSWVQDGASLPGLFGRSYRDGTALDVEDGLYRPVTIASFVVQAGLFGTGPSGFHAVNVLLHGIVAWLVFSVVCLLFEDRTIAFLAALLYAVHAAISEAVINVSGRAEILAALFALGAWLVLLRDPRFERRVGTLAFAGALAFLAYFSKESALALPGLVLAGDALLRSRELSREEAGREASLVDGLLRLASSAWQRLGLLVAVAAIYLVARVTVLGGLGLSTDAIPYLDNPAAHADTGARLVTAIGVLGRYVGLLVVPWTLSADYSFDQIPVSVTPGAWTLLGLVVMVAAVVLPFLRRRFARRYGFAALVFFGALFIASNLVVPVGTIMAERLLYLPAMGFVLAVALGVRERLSARAAVVAIGIVCVLLAARTVARVPDWKDRDAFNRAAVRTSPRSVKALFNAANTRQSEGDLEGAVAGYREAVERYEEYGKAWMNLGLALRDLGRDEEAKPAFERAADADPRSAGPWFQLGEIFLQEQRLDDAVDALRKAAERSEGDPRAPRIFIRLAEAYILTQDLDGARAAFEEALVRGPNDPDAMLRVARIRFADGDVDEAMRLLRRALSIDPSNPGAKGLLGTIEASRERP